MNLKKKKKLNDFSKKVGRESVLVSDPDTCRWSRSQRPRAQPPCNPRERSSTPPPWTRWRYPRRCPGDSRTRWTPRNASSRTRAGWWGGRTCCSNSARSSPAPSRRTTSAGPQRLSAGNPRGIFSAPCSGCNSLGRGPRTRPSRTTSERPPANEPFLATHAFFVIPNFDIHLTFDFEMNFDLKRERCLS